MRFSEIIVPVALDLDRSQIVVLHAVALSDIKLLVRWSMVTETVAMGGR